MISLVFSNGGGNDGRPPRRPPRALNRTPCTEEQVDHAVGTLVQTLEQAPFALGALHELMLRFRRAAGEHRDDRAWALIDIFAEDWRHSHELMTLLTAWGELRAPTKDALAGIAEAARPERDPLPDAYTRAIEQLISTMTPEQIASVAGALNRARARAGTQPPSAHAHAIADALALMNAAQLTALAPVASAMIDGTRLRGTRLRTAIRGLLMHLNDLDDWVSLIGSAVRHLRGHHDDAPDAGE